LQARRNTLVFFLFKDIWTQTSRETLDDAACNRRERVEVPYRTRVGGVKSSRLEGITSRRAREGEHSGSARGHNDVGKGEVIVEAASSTSLELNRGLADTEKLGLGVAADGARKGDRATSGARIGLSAKGELAITLGAEVVVNFLAGASDDTIALGWDGRGGGVVVVEEGIWRFRARLLLNGLSSSSELTSRDPNNIAVSIAVNGALAEPVLVVGVHHKVLSRWFVVGVDLSNIDPLTGNTSVVCIRPARSDPLVEAVVILIDNGRPASIDFATSRHDAEALLVASSVAERVLSISGEVGVLMAGVPIVQVVEEEGVEGRSVVLEVDEETNLKGLSADVNVHSVEVEETAPTEATTVALRHSAGVLCEILVDDVVMVKGRQ
jgi:hypothetical protein